ncbi:slo-interacting protein 1 isoform X1 [Anastrepha ludens]|uniref:slo-interacting protein 1 isoform X1 n=1 Tax=Anastrepha ludens TaxID=28586 RepID=UPI0023B1ED6C|nr:slo-interacting protein 1 isoform X1 [Anastrepha ludens]
MITSCTMMTEISFVVLKINGADISQLPEDKVVQMFLTTGEPLLVEMHRKPSTTPTCSTSTNPNYNERDFDDVSAKMANLKITPSVKSNTEQSIKVDNADLTSTIKLIVAINSSVLTAMGENAVSRVSKSTQTENSYFIYDNSKETSEHFIEHEHNLLEQCLAPEIDIEEITLRKSDSNERLGLIVCYNGYISNGNGSENNGALSSSDDNDACIEVYISGVQPGSVAGRDGRLRQGDQILQINGKYIKNKEETELLIAENNNAVTLLVSRYLFTDEDDFNDPLLVDLEADDEDDVEEEYYVESKIAYENRLVQDEPANELEKVLAIHSESKVKKHQDMSIENQPSVTLINVDTILGVDTVSSLEQKSTCVSSYQPKNVTSTVRNEKSLNQLSSQPECLRSIGNLHHNLVKRNLRSYKMEQPSWILPSPFRSLKNVLNDQQHINYDTEHIYETIPEDSESEPFYCSPYESSTHVTSLGSYSSPATGSLQQQQKNVANWLGICSSPTAMTESVIPNTVCGSKEAVHSMRACSRKQLHNDSGEMILRKKNNTLRSTLTTITNGSSSSGGSVNSAASNIADVSQNEERDYSSSAYNTGGSNNSTIPLVSGLNQNNGLTDDWSIPSLSGALDDPIKFSPSHLYNNDSNQCQIIQKHHLHPVLSQNQMHHHQNLCCPQFIAPNLSQYHFVSSQEVRTGTQQVMAVSPRAAEVVNHKTLSKEENMVWKVKRRQDGTRYIVRRPARNRCLLRDRSICINTATVRNRDISTTTEEDNISDIKVGRYWSKEERRKHIERARERKQQHQQQQQIIDVTNASKMCVKEQFSLKLPQQKYGLTQQQRSSQQRFTEYSGNQIQQRNISTSLQQHYQLQFNSSKIQQQKQTRIVGRCDYNGTSCVSGVLYNEKQLILTKEPTLEASEIEPCGISTQIEEIIPMIDKSSCGGLPSSLVVSGLQAAASVKNTSTFPVSAEGCELQNCISITTI